jgi:hypothetical protein
MRASALAFALLLAVAASAQVLSTEVVDTSSPDQNGLVQPMDSPSGFGAAPVPRRRR